MTRPQRSGIGDENKGRITISPRGNLPTMALLSERTRGVPIEISARPTYVQLFCLYGGLLDYLLGVLCVFTEGSVIRFEGLLALIFVY
jgi:hypothetical protein